MRYFLFCAILFFSISSSATHIIGGNITWECVGTNQYIFTLEAYKDCSLNSATFTSTQIISGPQGNITVNLASVESMVISCYADSNRCGFTNPAASELWTYKSLPIILYGTPPPAGWDFTFELCCHPVTVNTGNLTGVLIRSKFYNDRASGGYSSPYFISNPLQHITPVIKSISTMAESPQVGDSLHYRFAQPLDVGNTSKIFTAGYSFDNPFPNQNTDPANGAVSLNAQNGLITFDSKVGSNGVYYYTTVVEQWRGRVLVAEIYRDAVVNIEFGGIANNIPSVILDTNSYPVVKRNGNAYFINAVPGDTLNFNIVANDNDLLAGTNNLQEITFSAQGQALDTTWAGPNNYANKATFTPVTPQLGFTSTIKNEVKFNWVVGKEHTSGYSTRHFFNVQFADNQCPTVGVKNIILQVKIIDKTVSLDENEEPTWSIYPNPATEQIQIAGLSGASTIELHDVNGKVVRTIFLKKDQTEVSLTRNELASGLYFIKVQFENSTSVKKVLFE